MDHFHSLGLQQDVALALLFLMVPLMPLFVFSCFDPTMWYHYFSSPVINGRYHSFHYLQWVITAIIYCVGAILLETSAGEKIFLSIIGIGIFLIFPIALRLLQIYSIKSINNQINKKD